MSDDSWRQGITREYTEEIASLRAQLAARDEVIAQQEAVAAEYANARRELWRQAVDAQRLVVERDSMIAALREALDEIGEALAGLHGAPPKVVVGLVLAMRARFAQTQDATHEYEEKP